MSWQSWTINGRTVEFENESHTYLVDGLTVPSVTQILATAFNDYARVSARVLQEASEKGTALHKAIEVYETTGKASELKEFRNYLFLKRYAKIENVANEIPVIYEENGKVLFAGQLDQIYKIGDCYGINDFKRVSTPNREKIAHQLNLYKIAYEQSYHQQIQILSFMQLREDVRKFTPLPISEQSAKNLLENYYQEN